MNLPGNCSKFTRHFRESAPSVHSHETVGAVALDCHGNMAFATSTGGITAKRPGRVGDSPIIGERHIKIVTDGQNWTRPRPCWEEGYCTGYLLPSSHRDRSDAYIISSVLDKFKVGTQPHLYYGCRCFLIRIPETFHPYHLITQVLHGHLYDNWSIIIFLDLQSSFSAYLINFPWYTSDFKIYYFTWEVFRYKDTVFIII